VKDWSDMNRNGYAPVASLYHLTRPSCPVELVDRIVRHVGVEAGDAVAEIGAGTGLFTRRLSGRGLRITALEPVPGMRAQAAALPDVTWTCDTFERTGLPDGSQQWVVCCQAFQWADLTSAVSELRRVLRPGAWFTTLWYAYDVAREPVLQRSYALLRERIPAYRYVDRTTRARRLASRVLSALPEWPQRALSRLSALASERGGRGSQLQGTGAFGKLVYHEARMSTSVDRQGYLDLWRSRTRLSTLGPGGAFDGFVAAVAADLEQHRVDHVDVPYIFGAWSARARTV
jgi:SAM-dependent methyltransferase